LPQILGMGLGGPVPPSPRTLGRVFAPPGLRLEGEAAAGVLVVDAPPQRLQEDDLLLLPGGPEPDDPWLLAGLQQGATVRWAQPLAMACGLPAATVSRHAGSDAPWPAGQGMAIYGHGGPRVPEALLRFAQGTLLQAGERREGGLEELLPTFRSGDVLYIPPFGARSALPLAACAAVMTALRAPAGCPWDREQTHESLLPYLLEEAAEVYDALVDDDLHGIVEELGDLFLQVLFHAELGREEGTFDIGDVADGLWRKLVRRHPHVFGDEHFATAEDFLPRWDELKAEEGKRRQSELDGIPASLSSLAALEKAMRKLMRCGIAQLADGGYAGLFAERVAAGEDLELEARSSLRRLRERCRQAEAILGVRLSQAGPAKAAEAWEMAQNARVDSAESRNE